MPSTLTESSLDAIERLADAGLSAQELLDEAAARIDRAGPTDGYFMAATDPETTLAIGTGVVRELPAEWCQPHWDYEFLVPDYLKYAEIARSGRHVADIHDATGGRPDASPRFKHYSADTGYGAEVRLIFTVGDAAWGLAQLNRYGDVRFTDGEKAWLERASAVIAPRPTPYGDVRFPDGEKAWLGRASAIIARGLRQAMVAEPASSPPPPRGPGVVLLDGAGRVVSATREAVDWLDELDPEMLMSDVG